MMISTITLHALGRASWCGEACNWFRRHRWCWVADGTPVFCNEDLEASAWQERAQVIIPEDTKKTRRGHFFKTRFYQQKFHVQSKITSSDRSRRDLFNDTTFGVRRPLLTAGIFFFLISEQFRPEKKLCTSYGELFSRESDLHFL